MIKVTKTDRDVSSAEIRYPVLMQSHKGSIVLFTSLCEGLTLKYSNEALIGDFSSDWEPATDADVWTRYAGKITLENSNDA